MPQPYVYSAREYGNMLMCLGEARGNASLALRIYRERHPNVRHPSDSRIITAAFQRVLENRPIAPAASGGGRPADVQSEERILEVVRRNPRLGTRSAAKLLRRRNGSVVSHWLVHKVLRRERMRPYKVHKVHAPNFDAPSSCGNISPSPPLHRDEWGTIRAPPCSIAKDLA
ncbi:hypothetical protein SFRURICE_003595, partial [Spodoptera frugiperda]